MKLAIIANPEAGKGHATKNSLALRDHLEKKGAEVVVHETSCRGDGEEMAMMATKDGATSIVACGGDGTVQEVINGIKAGTSKGNEPTLAILPAGRCNNFWKELGAPSDPAIIAISLTEGRSKRVDLGKVGDRYFATVAALGFDSAVAEFVDDGRSPKFLRGTASYLYGLIATLPNFRFPVVQMTGDTSSFKGPVLLMAVGNTASYGGSFMITPSASPYDGWLDICIVRQISKLEVLKVLPQVFSGLHVNHPDVLIKKTKTLTVDTDIPVWIWADGERITSTPATISVEESTISVIIQAYKR